MLALGLRVFQDSRGWCFLTVWPGVEPIKALVEVFLETWRFDAGDPARIKQRNEWMELLLDQNRKTNLPDRLTRPSVDKANRIN